MLKALICLLGGYLASFAVALAQYAIQGHTLDGGGGASTGGVYEVSGTIGQPAAGTADMAGGPYAVRGGFWAAVAVQFPGAPPAAPGTVREGNFGDTFDSYYTKLGPHEFVARVAHERRARVSHERHIIAALEPLDELGGAPIFTVGVMADQRRLDLVARPQLACHPRQS